ncbi:MAG: ABC transporter permease [Candidatus Babeliales bacterium]
MMHTISYIQRLTWFLSDTWELVKRNLFHIFRDLDQIFGLITQPIIYTLLFLFLFGGAINVGSIDYVNYLIPGMLVTNVLFASIVTSVGISNDLKTGIIDRFRSLPISQCAVINSYIIASVLRAVIVILIVFILGLILGFRPTTGPQDWFFAFGILLLMAFATSCLLTLIGFISKSVEAAQQFAALIVLPFAMISPALVPINTLPYFLRIFAEHQPYTHTIEAVRSLLFGNPLSNHLLMSLTWFLTIIIITFTLTSYLFSKRS